MLPDSGWGAERVQRARQQEKAQTDVLTPNVSATGFPNLSIDKALGMSGMRLPVSGSGDRRQEHGVQISDICLNASTAESVVATFCVSASVERVRGFCSRFDAQRVVLGAFTTESVMR